MHGHGELKLAAMVLAVAMVRSLPEPTLRQSNIQCVGALEEAMVVLWLR
jgi:hypothetical protein